MLKNKRCIYVLSENEREINPKVCKQMSVVDDAKTDMEYNCGECYTK